jgi:hypothetical protein
LCTLFTRLQAGGLHAGCEQRFLGDGLIAVWPVLAAKKVLIVPGYGLAVANAQYAIADLVKGLKKKGVEVT